MGTGKDYKLLTSPVKQLKAMETNDILCVPNKQRVSITGTIARIHRNSKSRFMTRKIDSDFFIIVRVK